MARERLCPYKLMADKPWLGTAFEFGIHTHKSFALHKHIHSHTYMQANWNRYMRVGHMCATICRPCVASALLNSATLLLCCLYFYLYFHFSIFVCSLFARWFEISLSIRIPISKYQQRTSSRAISGSTLAPLVSQRQFACVYMYMHVCVVIVAITLTHFMRTFFAILIL